MPASNPPKARRDRRSDLVLIGRPALCEPRRDARLIEELAELLAAALIADVQEFPKCLELQLGNNATVVSPRGHDHKFTLNHEARDAHDGARLNECQKLGPREPGVLLDP